MGVVVIIPVWFSNLQDSMNRDNNKTPFDKNVLPTSYLIRSLKLMQR